MPKWGRVSQAEIDAAIAVHAAILDAHTRNLWQTLRTGYYFHQNIFGATQALTANRIYATPIVIPRNLTIDRLAVEVTTGDAGKVALIGIYADGTNLYPGALTKDYGEVSVEATGIIASEADKALTKGIYWIVIISNGTPTIRRGAGYEVQGGLILGFAATDFSYKLQGYMKNLTYPSPAVLPATFPAAADDSYLTLGVLPRLKTLD